MTSSDDDEIYFDAAEGYDRNTRLSGFGISELAISRGDQINNDCVEKRNRIESLKQSAEARTFTLTNDLPIVPELLPYEDANAAMPCGIDRFLGGGSNRITLPRRAGPFSGSLSSQTSQFLSRTLPERPVFTTTEGFQSHLFTSTRLAHSFRGGPDWVSELPGLPRSLTAHPACCLHGVQPIGGSEMVNVLPQSVRFHNQLAPFTGGGGAGGHPRPPEMASAPEVSLSRRNHPDIQDYVKSWSLDAARYRPNLLTDDAKDPFPTLLVPPVFPDELLNAQVQENKATDAVVLQVDVSVQARLDTPTSSSQPSNRPAVETQVTMKSAVPSADSTVSHADFSDSRTHIQQAAATMPTQSVSIDRPSIAMNPMSLDYRTRTLSASSLQYSGDSSKAEAVTGGTLRSPNLRSSVRRFQSVFKGAMTAFRSATKAKIFSQDEQSSDEDVEVIGNQGIRLRCSRKIKGHRDFLQIKLVQEMQSEHTGAIWAMRASPCGRLLATAGHDRNIRIWVLRQWYSYFKEMQQISAGHDGDASVPPTHSVSTARGCLGNLAMSNHLDDLEADSISLTSTSVSTSRTDDGASSCSSGPLDNGTTYSRGEVPELGEVTDPVPIKLPQQRAFYRSQPLLVYRGHDGVVTELAWSKNLFLLSTGMDRQVRLWHVSRCECLCVFSHSDTVPAIVFHPKDDRYFLSGSLDGKLRLWNIPDKKVRFWVDAPLPSSLPASAKLSAPSASGIFEPKTIITCACFACDGTKVVIGSYDGRVMFFNTELTYITFINVKSTSSRGRQCRITAIEVDPTDSNKLLVTSNDSRVRLIDARDYHTLCKYRGFVNESSQIRASFSPTARYIISGSENCFFYIWRKQLDFLNVSRFSTSRKDRNNYWESIKAHDAAVTVAIFLPNPGLLLDKRLRRWNSARRRTGGDLRLRSYHGDGKAGIGPNSRHMPYLGEVIVSADSRGCIRVLKNRVHNAAVSSESAAT
ncbi:hypothetical protein AAHC03_01551 [Spirometra sp. Aus1]